MRMRIHEYLEIVSKGDGEKAVIRCMKCGYEFGPADENYKKRALVWERDVKEFPQRAPVSGDSMFTCYQEFICPGCGTLLEVDSFCPELDKDEPIVWDIQIKV